MRLSSAFTLIELLVVLAISAILLVTVIPFSRDLYWRSRSHSEINKLIGLMHYARSAAIQRNLAVSLCPSQDGEHCGGQWQQGILIFTDANASGNANNKQILRVIHGFSRHATLIWRGFARGDFINIPPYAVSQNAAGSFFYCPQVAAYQRYAKRLVVNRLGRIRLSHHAEKANLRKFCQVA